MRAVNAPMEYVKVVSTRQMTGILSLVVALLAAIGFIWAESTEALLAYFLVLFAAVLPSIIWIRMGATGIPVLAVVSWTYIPYFAWPVLGGNESTLDYTLSEVVESAATVALFLIVATAIWWPIASKARTRGAGTLGEAKESRVIGLLLLGLFAGIVFQVGNISGLLDEFKSFFGLIRSIAITYSTVSCFLIGVTRAQGVLRGKAWAAALAGIGVLIGLSWSSLFLVGGLINILAVVFGYVIVSRRVPWVAMISLVILVTVLHAGKAEMRAKYWELESTSGTGTSLAELPSIAVEWFGEGIYALSHGLAGQSPLDRASLLQMVLMVESRTPSQVDFLNGETYSYLPSILVPRFIDANKPASQIGMDLLNIRYGLLTVEGVETTAIGWGLIAEAYANFGYSGVIGIALLLGAFCGLLQSWSAKASIVSIPTLIGVASMMTLINIEADFIQVCTTLLQSCVSVLIFSIFYRWFAADQSLRSGPGNRVS